MLELLYVLLLASILTTVGLFSFSLISKNQKQMLVDTIQSAINYARIESINLGESVCITPIENNKNWMHGMELVQINKTMHETQLLNQWRWHYPKWIIQWEGATHSNRLIFSANPEHAMSNGTFRLFNTATKESVDIKVNRFGRVRVST